VVAEAQEDVELASLQEWLEAYMSKCGGVGHTQKPCKVLDLFFGV